MKNMQTECQLKEFCLDHHHHGDRDQSLINDHHEKVSEIKEEIGHLVENMDPAKDRGIFSTTGHQQVGHCHHHPEMQKVGDTRDISLLSFLAGANFWATQVPVAPVLSAPVGSALAL